MTHVLSLDITVYYIDVYHTIMPQLSTKYDNTRLGVIRLWYRFDNVEMLHVDIILENNIRQVNTTYFCLW